MIVYPSIQAIREQAPFPWSQQIGTNGRILVLDAKGVEVPVLALTALAMFVTNHLARQPEQKAS